MASEAGSGGDGSPVSDGGDGTSGSEGGDGGDGAPPKKPVCGNGEVQAGEACDDGNRDERDDCLNTCVEASCGDGVLHDRGSGSEICDNGEDNGPFPAVCSSFCRLTSCGNAELEPGEECDDNDADSDDCTYQCLWNVCGDGVVYASKGPGGDENPNPVEECDDGNTDDDDGCDNECRRHPVDGGRCGDGVWNLGEECDDGNTNNADDCLSSCIAARCGDGVIHAGKEICDNGEENGPFPAVCPETCVFMDCGSGVVAPGDECDDADENGDTASCLRTCQFNACGDGHAYLHETPGTNNPNELEQCDDNSNNSDACTEECRWNVCGDGFVYTRDYADAYAGDSEEDGNPEDDNTAPLEHCDDGNTDDGDGCSADCTLEP